LLLIFLSNITTYLLFAPKKVALKETTKVLAIKPIGYSRLELRVESFISNGDILNKPVNIFDNKGIIISKKSWIRKEVKIDNQHVETGSRFKTYILDIPSKSIGAVLKSSNTLKVFPFSEFKSPSKRREYEIKI